MTPRIDLGCIDLTTLRFFLSPDTTRPRVYDVDRVYICCHMYGPRDSRAIGAPIRIRSARLQSAPITERKRHLLKRCMGRNICLLNSLTFHYHDQRQNFENLFEWFVLLDESMSP